MEEGIRAAVSRVRTNEPERKEEFQGKEDKAGKREYCKSGGKGPHTRMISEMSLGLDI